MTSRTAAPRPRRTQAERKEATTEKLVAACVELLSEAGYSGATVKAICDRAGLSQGALFRHFPTRIELLVRVIDVLGQRTLSDFGALGGGLARPSSRAEVEAWVRAMRRVSRSPSHAAWREVVAAARVEPELASAARGAVARFEGAIIDFVAALVPGSPAEIERAAAVVLSLLHMFDSEAVTVVVKANPKIEAQRVRWAVDVLGSLFER